MSWNSGPSVDANTVLYVRADAVHNLSDEDRRMAADRQPLAELGVSRSAYKALRGHYLWSAQRPVETVGEVLDLAQADKLSRVRGLGPERRAEVVNALREFGLDPTPQRRERP